MLWIRTPKSMFEPREDASSPPWRALQQTHDIIFFILRVVSAFLDPDSVESGSSSDSAALVEE
jgi:hypothetical protein